jgi:hypothetical protein
LKFLNGWSLAILLLVILPGGGFVSIEVLQRHCYSSMVDRLDASLRDLETGVRMECVDPLNRHLEVATGAAKYPIRRKLQRELRNEDLGWGKVSKWNLIASCDRHDSGHGLRMEFVVRQERRYLLRSPKVTMQMNIGIPRSLEPLLQRALQGVDVERYAFEY